MVGQDFGPSAGFGVFSLNAGYAISKQVKLSLGVDNLFDKAYAEHLNLAGDAGFGFPATRGSMNLAAACGRGSASVLRRRHALPFRRLNGHTPATTKILVDPAAPDGGVLPIEDRSVPRGASLPRIDPAIQECRPVNDMEDIAARLVEVLDALDLKESADADIDAYLDARDEDPFDSDWLSAHQELESRKRGLDEASSCASWNAPTGLRERVFKRVLGQAGDDIAGYISDDFGLMFDALAMDDLEASWVFGLYEVLRKRDASVGIDSCQAQTRVEIARHPQAPHRHRAFPT